MSERMDQFAAELLLKTQSNKLEWIPVQLDPDEEEFSIDLGEGYRFHALSSRSGEDRDITLQLFHDQRILDEAAVKNWSLRSDPRMDTGYIKRFRLYSDLVDAVRENLPGGEKDFNAVEQLLRKIS